MLLYADDMVILDRHQVDLHHKLRALECYFDLKGLRVNIAKTKILHFQRSGRSRKLNPLYTLYKGVPFESTRSYMYLGVLMSRSALGLQATLNSASKGKAASGVVSSLLLKSKCSSPATYKTLFNSMVTSTVLYAFPAWGLQHVHLIEKIQLAFFRRYLGLPRCTPGYAIRSELLLTPLKTTALKLTLSWITKVLKMDFDSLPQLILMRLIHLANSLKTPSPYN